MNQEETDKKREAERVYAAQQINNLRDVYNSAHRYKSVLQYWEERRPRPPLDGDDPDAQEVRRCEKAFKKSWVPFLERVLEKNENFRGHRIEVNPIPTKEKS